MMKKIFGIICAALLMPSMVFAAPVVGIIRGGTGTSTPPTYGKVMVGNSSGGWDYKATSTIGLAPGSIFADNNTWTGLNIFANSTSTLGTIDTFWSTNALITNGTFTNSSSTLGTIDRLWSTNSSSTLGTIDIFWSTNALITNGTFTNSSSTLGTIDRLWSTNSSSTLGTIDTFWSTTASLTNATTTSLGITGLATPAGALLSVDPSGNVVATSSVSLTPWVENIDAGGYNLTDVGDLGIGTSTPQASLHIADAADAVLRFSGYDGGGGYEYEMRNNGNTFFINSLTSGAETASPNFVWGNYSDSYLFNIYGTGAIANSSGNTDTNYLYGDLELDSDLTVTGTTTSAALELTDLTSGILFADGTYQYTAGGSLTPWVSDVDADTYSLIDVGKIGIGTSTPSAPLTINDGTGAVYGGITFEMEGSGSEMHLFHDGDRLAFQMTPDTDVSNSRGFQINTPGGDGIFGAYNDGSLSLGNSTGAIISLNESTNMSTGFTYGWGTSTMASAITIMGTGNKDGGIAFSSGEDNGLYSYLFDDGSAVNLSTKGGEIIFIKDIDGGSEFELGSWIEGMMYINTPVTIDGATRANSLTETGTVVASSTSNAAEILLESDLNTTLIEYTPNVESVALSLPPAASITTVIPTAGDRKIIQIFNATTTAGIDITLDEGGDSDYLSFNGANFTITISPDFLATIALTRLTSGKIYVEKLTP